MDRKTMIIAAAGAAVVVAAAAFFLTRKDQEETEVAPAAARPAAPAVAEPVAEPAPAAAPAAPEPAAPKPAAPVAAPAAAPTAAAAAKPAATAAAAPQESAAAAAAAALAAAAAGGDASKISKKMLMSIYADMVTSLQRLKEMLSAQAELDEDGVPVDIEMFNMRLAGGLQAIEESIHAKYGVTQADLLAAHAAYKDDEEVMEASRGLQSAFHSGEAVPVPEELTADVFYEKFCMHVDTVDALFHQVAAEARAEYPKPGKARIEYLSSAMYQQLDEVSAKAAEAAGLSEDVFHACLMKYQDDPRFLQKIMESQQRQEQVREALLKE